MRFVSLSSRSTTFEKELLIPRNGKSNPPKGRYERNPSAPAGGIISENGML